MKIIKKLNIKKIFRSLKTGALSTNIFFFLIGIYFSTLAVAAILTVTSVDHRIPSGAAECFSSQTGARLNNDRTEDLRDVIWSEDGTMIFTVNKLMQSSLDLSMNKVYEPFQLQTVKTIPTDDVPHTCDDIDGFNPAHSSFVAQGGSFANGEFRSIHIAQGGKIFYMMSGLSEIHRYDLSTAFDFRTAKYVQELTLTPIVTNVGDGTHSINGFSMSRDGTRLFYVDQGAGNDAPVLKTLSLSTAFDITTGTEIHSVELFTIGLDDEDGVQAARDVEFSPDGSQMFIAVYNLGDKTNNQIHQFNLGKNFDVSTATDLGHHTIVYPDGSTGNFWGMSFSSDGMHLFITQLDSPGGRVDQVHQYTLECPYGVVSCSSEASQIIVSQVELAKQNISLNIDTIFKRFEWIKRNRDNEDLTSHNIDINYPNPLLRSLASKFEPSLKNNLATLVSNTKQKEKKKKSKWSSWSIAEISVGNFDETLLDKPKDIYTKGLTFGSDRKFGDSKFFGLAVRYGNSESDIRRSQREVDLESLTLNIYGVVPTSNTQYINAVLGLSALRFDNKYIGELSGERNGKQVFGTINYRTKSAYSKLNITPTGKFTYGVTQLSEFTDFLSNTIDGPTTDRRYAKDTFESGEFAGGLLFEMEKFVSDQGTLQPMGGIEIIYDLTDDITYKYQNVGATAVNKEILSGKYSRQSLKTNIGFEAIHTNGFTVSTDYQRTIRLNDKSDAPLFTKEKFIIKLSKSKEDDTQFVFDFDPLMNNYANLSYAKDIGNFNLKFNSNYSSINRISDYGANIELSGTF